MQLMSISERTRTSEKSNADRSHLVVPQRAQARATHDLYLDIRRLVRWRHATLLPACCENSCADNPLAPRRSRGLLSCRPSFSCAGPELRRLDQARRPSGLLADRAEMHASRRAFLWHEVSIEVTDERREIERPFGV
jgi:hypothetical protein